MKTLLFSKNNRIFLLTLMFFSLLFIASLTYAYGRHHYYCYGKASRVPVAVCTTGTTSALLPPYVCCELLNSKGKHIWRDTWVSGTCSNANVSARHDFGCSVSSPVYGTNSPIIGNCQFSYSTGEY